MSANNTKKLKKEEEHENRVDIISSLPDHILDHIFSFVDMKQAIQTCLLSRRWRYFWVSLPILKFIYIEQTSSSWNEFTAFVDRVLMFRDKSNIHEFKIVTEEEYTHVSETTINTWILASVIRNAQQITLDIQFPWKFHFHHCLFSSKSLKQLVLSANHRPVCISLPDSITLPSLKTLFLDFVQFEDKCVMDQLFSSCPVLESLSITNCEFLHDNINISSPRLKHLVLEHCGTKKNALDLGPVDIKFQFCTPNLISFCWYNDMSIRCDPNNLSSLVRANITVFEDSKMSKEKKKAMYVQCMVNIQRELHNVEDLTLSTSFLEVVTGAPDLLDSQLTQFGNLTCLKLTGPWLSIDCIHGISYLLSISPNIETLSIEYWHDFKNAATDLLDVQPTQFCNLRCLKMDTLLSKDWIYAVACLLKICPNTETLSHTVYHEEDSDDEMNYKNDKNDMNPYWDEINSDPAIKRDYWEAGLSLECLLNHLKCFELRGVTGRINELEFLEILLKNATLLKKLLIIFQKSYSVVVDDEERRRVKVDADDEERRRVKFTEKVLTFPRASLSVVILFR